MANPASMPQDVWRDEIWTTASPLFEAAKGDLVELVVLGALATIVWSFVAPKIHHHARTTIVVVMAIFFANKGYVLASEKMSVFDDAYISFRYAMNLVDGHGLVFNVGERVEGYTNFLWTIMVAFAVRLTGNDAPDIGLSLSLTAFVLNLFVIAWLSTMIGASSTDKRGKLVSVLPFAVVVLAAQDTFTTYGTTGLETGFASLMVNVGIAFLIRKDDDTHAALAGTFFILGAFTRPDHALFFVVAAGTLVVRHGRALYAAREQGVRALFENGGRRLVFFAAPASVYAVYLVVKRSWYGDALPNTYYAKSADLTYWEQGEIYTRAFFVQSHMWLLVVPFVVGTTLAMWRGTPRARAFALMALPSVVIYTTYVTRVGGDFMHGRFFVSVLPLLVLGTLPLLEGAAARFPIPGRVAFLVVASVAFAGRSALPMFEGRAPHWYILEERFAYPAESRDPVVIGHSSYTVGKKLGEITAEGFAPLVATSGVGMVGFYGQTPVLDLVGLTDKRVARQRLKERGRPGHEKWAKHSYVKERNPHFIRSSQYIERAWRDVTKFTFGPRSGRAWNIYHYDGALMRHLKVKHPEMRFVDFEAWLDDYIRLIDTRTLSEINRDVPFFKRYYFDHNDDDARQSAIEKRIAQLEAPSPTVNDEAERAPTPAPSSSD